MEKDIIEFYPDNKKIALFVSLIILPFFLLCLSMLLKKA